MAHKAVGPETRGRVLAFSGRSLVLFDAGQTRVVDTSALEFAEADAPPGPGDLVRVDDGRLSIVARGPGQWPPAREHAAAGMGRLLGGGLRKLQLRSSLLQQTRAWFVARGFMEVETPLLVTSPGTETHLDPVRAKVAWTPGAPAEDAWLITSPEYAMKRLLAAGAGPIFQLGRVFRDGERGGNHRPEFTMLEWYRPWRDDGYEGLFGDCEELIRTLAARDTLRWKGRDLDLRPPWRRVTFFDALRDRADIANPRGLGPDAWLQALVDRVEPTLGAEGPEFLTEWPMELASLARRNAADPAVAERFELYVGQLELANAFAELTDAAEQRARCEADNTERRESGRPEMPLDEAFLGALAVGLPPSTGIALGFDRLVMLLTDSATIDEVSAF